MSKQYRVRISNHNNIPARLQTPLSLASAWRPVLSRSSPILTSIFLIIVSMSSAREQIPPRRKRRRTEADPSPNEPSESQPSKRLKQSFALHSAAFYDSLSKVPLTRRSLKELDRRTSRVNGPQRPIPPPRQRVNQEDSLKRLRRFARHGGPDLRDLRAVRLPDHGVRPFLITCI